MGSIPWTIALIYAGKVLGDNWESVRTFLGKFDYLIVALIVVAVVWYIYRHVSRAMASPEESSEA
ncbi:MAG TPA: hypothetical protein VMW65_17140 [Chloroflexota bacterium]|nr:hypothetical protein [Chloroflexota bacterium]